MCPFTHRKVSEEENKPKVKHIITETKKPEELTEEEKKRPYFKVYRADDIYKDIYSFPCEDCGKAIKTNEALVIMWERTKEEYGMIYCCSDCYHPLLKKVIINLKSGRMNKAEWEFLKYVQKESSKVIPKEQSKFLTETLNYIQKHLTIMSDDLNEEINKYMKNILESIKELMKKDKDFYERKKNEIEENSTIFLNFIHNSIVNILNRILEKSTIALNSIEKSAEQEIGEIES